MQRKINIKGLDKSKVLAGLYNHAIIQKVAFFSKKTFINKFDKMTIEEAREQIVKQQTLKSKLYFSEVNGKAINVDLSNDEFDPFGYDHIYGAGTAFTVIRHIKRHEEKLFQLGQYAEDFIAEEVDCSNNFKW